MPTRKVIFFYLFFVYLKTFFNNSNYIWPVEYIEWLVNSELEKIIDKLQRMWKEVVVA
jgi:hypothetical protein